MRVSGQVRQLVTLWMLVFLHYDKTFIVYFLHTDCLFSKNPDLELEALFKRHFTQVVFYKGTAMSTRDLERVKVSLLTCVQTTKKCFTNGEARC